MSKKLFYKMFKYVGLFIVSDTVRPIRYGGTVSNHYKFSTESAGAGDLGSTELKRKFVSTLGSISSI